MSDHALIGRMSGFSEILIEALPLKRFAQATGEPNPIYFDLVAARAAGYPNILAPLTYVSCLENFAPPPGLPLGELGFPLEKLLHGEQHFSYLEPLFAGDYVRLQMRIVDVYEKKSGTLKFLAIETLACKPGPTLAVRSRSLYVVVQR